MRDLNPREQEVLDLLGEAWTVAGGLHEIARGSSDTHELTHAIHAAQNIILARPGYEEQVLRRNPAARGPGR